MVTFNSLFFYFFSEQFFMNLWPKKKKLVCPKKKSKSQASGRIPCQVKDRCWKMGSLLLEAEISDKELLRQLKAGAGGGAKDKKQ